MSTFKGYILLPIALGFAMAFGIFIGHSLSGSEPKGHTKLDIVLDYIRQEYVDTVSEQMLADKTIEAMLSQLDPHSAYIPAEELQGLNEALEGNFEGIGVEFHVQEDTIMVVSAIAGGPSEKVGLQSGDRIVKVNGKTVAGIGITNEQVQKELKGKGGTRVTVSIYRRGMPELINFSIVRGKIPLNSLEIAYMLNQKTGYIKLSKFSATTYEESLDAIKKLKSEGMENLILDLRGNPGGFLDAATKLADEFLSGKKLIVYTQGKARPKTEYKAGTDGAFETGKLIVLIDEGSASASEIVAGAIQDWDRGTIIGRRSFGKGLVQEQTELPDGSAIRLTIARYYTPSGRSIQKPYQEGSLDYDNEISERFKHGELIHKDSIAFADSLQFKTAGGRKVYGGGGIMPDVFIPMDTSYESEWLNQLYISGCINQFPYEYVDRHRSELKLYKSADAFRKNFDANSVMLNEFLNYATRQGVKQGGKDFQQSYPFLCRQLKASIGRLLWQDKGLYPVLNDSDPVIQQSLKLIGQQP